MQGMNKIPFGIQTLTGKIVSVDDVPRGLKCDCHCPSCLGRLVARQGEKNVPHFSHFDRSSEKCEYAFATSVRLMLQEQFPALTGLNTPEHYVMVEGMRLQVAEASTGIPVRHVPQDTSQGTPAGLFQLVAHPDFHLAIHLPPAHEPDGGLPPAWLDEFTAAHPKWGVLGVCYHSFPSHLYSRSRPADMDTVQWMLTVLMQEADCLAWHYHPREKNKREQWLAKAEERRKEWERREEEVRRQEEEARLARAEELKRQAAEEKARREARWAEEARNRASAQQADRERQVNIDRYQSEASESGSGPKTCKHCFQYAPRIDSDGHCFRETCIASRKRPKPAPVATSRYQYGQARDRPMAGRYASRDWTDWAEPEPPRDNSNQCPHCGGDQGKGVRGWWCEHCEPKA